MSKKIKAILIDAYNREVKEIEVENTFEGPGGMYEIMKTDMIQHAPVHLQGNHFLVDEEGLLKSEISYFKFNNVPYFNNALIVGSKGMDYGDHKADLETIKNNVRFPGGSIK